MNKEIKVNPRNRIWTHIAIGLLFSGIFVGGLVSAQANLHPNKGDIDNLETLPADSSVLKQKFGEAERVANDPNYHTWIFAKKLGYNPNNGIELGPQQGESLILAEGCPKEQVRESIESAIDEYNRNDGYANHVYGYGDRCKIHTIIEPKGVGGLSVKFQIQFNNDQPKTAEVPIELIGTGGDKELTWTQRLDQVLKLVLGSSTSTTPGNS